MKLSKAIKKLKPKKILLSSKGETLFAGDKKALKRYFKSHEFTQAMGNEKEQINYFKRVFYNTNLTVEKNNRIPFTSFIVMRDIKGNSKTYDIYVLELKLN